MKRKLILVDDDISYDYRVNKDNGIFINCYDIEVSINLKDYIKVFFKNIFFVKNILKVFLFKLKFNSFFSALKKTIELEIKALKISNIILEKYMFFDEIKANDLFCGLVGLYIKRKRSKVYFIYDAHEVEFHRNRKKNSLFRIMYEMYLENKVIKYADKILVVSKPICELYKKIYKIRPEKIEIVNNNHFRCFEDYYLSHYNPKKEIGILYIGGGIKGRFLENLSNNAKKFNVLVYGFFMSDIPKVAIVNNWYLGDKNYLSDVMKIIKNKNLLMWVVHETSCLSYQYALPNKFFQAVALGIPIIIYKGTYLEEIVKKYHIGYVYNGNNFDEILTNVKDDKNFSEIVINMAKFQKEICNNRIIL